MHEKIDNKQEIPGGLSKIISESVKLYDKSISVNTIERSQNLNSEIKDNVQVEPYSNESQIKTEKFIENAKLTIKNYQHENKLQLKNYNEKSNTKPGTSTNVVSSDSPTNTYDIKSIDIPSTSQKPQRKIP